MDDVNITLKSRMSEVLETLNLIILLYTVFLIILGMCLRNSEVILQTCIMIVVYIIFEYINYDIIRINNKGITCEKYGFLPWKDMYIIRKKNRTFLIYCKTRSKPYKLIIKKSEERLEFDRAYKYIISKVKDPEKIKAKIL